MISLYCSSVTSKSKRGHVEDMTQNRSRHDRWQQQHTSTAVLFISSSNKVLWATLALRVSLLWQSEDRGPMWFFLTGLKYLFVGGIGCGGDIEKLVCSVKWYCIPPPPTVRYSPSFHFPHSITITMQPLALGYSVSPLSAVPHPQIPVWLSC